MKKLRIIAKLEINGNYVVKGIRMEGLRKIDYPATLCAKYFNEGIDEIYYEDIVSSLYGRNNISDFVTEAAKEMFIPLIVGGGVRSLDDFYRLLRCGADKISINTQAIHTPEIISEASKSFGSSCVIVSIQAKKQKSGSWEAYIENGRERTSVDVIDWVKRVEDLGAGEILLTSVDYDGTMRGLDIELIKKVTSLVSLPVIASGGTSSVDDIVNASIDGNASAIALGHLLHFNKVSIKDIKVGLNNNGIETRS